MNKNKQMEPKFKVALVFEHGYRADSDSEWVQLQEVTPESLSLQCPRCSVYSTMRIDATVTRKSWMFEFICTCVHCESTVFVQAIYLESENPENPAPEDATHVISIYPKREHINIQPEVPEKYSKDYREALQVVELSPKASAALSRRILQNVMREEFHISPKSLDKEINEFLGRTDIPSYLAKSIDAVRVVGNLAAHPLKDTNTGEIVDVEPGEAEWLLGLIEQLFDFAFVQPQRLQDRMDKLNTKLQSVGKPQLKKSS